MIKKQSQETIQSITKELLPYEFSRCHTTIEELIKEGWIIFQDNSGKWTGKDKINAMKLIKDTERTRFEIIMNGPLNLEVIHLREQIEDLKQDEDIDRIKGFMPPLLHSNLEDLK